MLPDPCFVLFSALMQGFFFLVNSPELSSGTFRVLAVPSLLNLLSRYKNSGSFFLSFLQCG